MKTIIFFITFSLTSVNIFSQIVSDSSETLSRLKLSVGYFGGRYVDVGEYLPFFNFNYRASLLLKHKDTPQFGFAFETGANIINGVFPLYAKVGPELEIVNNLIVAGNFGYIGILIYPVPFYGINIFLLNEITKTLNIEVEGGFHTSFGKVVEPLYYLSIGISLD